MSGRGSTVLPMPAHAFVDESVRRDYLLCAAVVPVGDLTVVRKRLRELCKPGQRRIHMFDESDSRRREILSALTQMELQTHVFEAPTARRSTRHTRDECLRALVPGLLELGVDRLVIESCDQDRRDRHVIFEALSKLSATEQLTYLHSAPASEALLWVADCVLWAYGRGGDWRRRTQPLIATVTKLA